MGRVIVNLDETRRLREETKALIAEAEALVEESRAIRAKVEQTIAEASETHRRIVRKRLGDVRASREGLTGKGGHQMRPKSTP